ncbi:MAG: hypothetical protein QOC97_948, partial [Chloroflexota bacterium]|nr:hypothetical protein [Chloroflexota bacterium]
MSHPRVRRASAIAMGALASVAVIGATLAAGNVRLTKDVNNGYVSAYTLATGNAYTDNTLRECNVARGRQNEPAVEMDPRNSSVLIGSSNDYCGVYQPPLSETPSPIGPIWLGYYRSENAGASFVSSLVPGYPDDTSPYAALAKIRTASAGDPVIAWDGHGRVFMGSESSDDPAGSKKTFGDVWVARYDNPGGPSATNTANDGKRFLGSSLVSKGSSAPNLLGVFNDKTSIEADRTGGTCDGNVYFAWSRFTGNGTNNIYLSRSTDHGVTWSTPHSLTSVAQDVQFPDISVTANGHVYVTFRQFVRKNGQPDALDIAKSVDCGATFGPAKVVQTFTPYDASDVAAPTAIPAGNALDAPFDEEASGNARDCGDFSSNCQSGYTFFRRDTQVRSTADQADTAHEWIYVVYDPSKPGTVLTGTTYGSEGTGIGSQSGIYFLRYDGASGMKLGNPALIDAQPLGHQLFPDISAGGGGNLHTVWWDSRNDPTYSPKRPVGNDAAGNTVASLDVYGAASTNYGASWTTSSTPVTSVRSNPNYEQFSNRAVPFAGDYLWVTSHGTTAYGTWTDWRDTVQGADPRERPEDQ